MGNPNPRQLPPQHTVRMVARFRDGTVLKGTSQNFAPTRPGFHLGLAEGGSRMVRLSDLKAVFFVRSFEGDPGREDLVGFIQSPMETSQGTKVAVLFQDGELICGHTLHGMSGEGGFFLVPADPASNNLRIWVVAGSALMVRTGLDAEALAQQTLDAKGRRAA